MADVPPELVVKLDELVRVLTESDHVHWARWMERARREIAAGDGHGIQRLLDAYGGMGSFNDLGFWPHEAEIAQRIDVLRGEVYAMASRVRSELRTDEGREGQEGHP